jgi:hypothetical protein
MTDLNWPGDFCLTPLSRLFRWLDECGVHSGMSAEEAHRLFTEAAQAAVEAEKGSDK